MKTLKALVLALSSLVEFALGNTTYSFANEAAEPPATTRSAQHWKRKTAIAIGKPEMANAADDDLDAAHDAHVQLVNEESDNMGEPDGMLDNEKKAEMGTLLANAITEQRITQADRAAWETKFANDFEAAKDDLAEIVKPVAVVPAANEALVKANAKAASLLIANAITEGRITPGEKEVWVGKFANDFDATETALAKETKKLKITPITKGIGKRSGEAIANEEQRRAKVTELVGLKMANGKLDYTRAYNLVQSENPQLFDSMTKPEVTK